MSKSQMSSVATGASMIIVNSQRQILMYLRDNKARLSYANCWDLLGGKVEPGESAEQCIKRELLEEIELDVKNPKLFGVRDMQDRIEHTFWTELDLAIANTRLHEGQHLQWFSQSEVTALSEDQVAFGFKSILLDFFRKQPWNRETN